MKHHSHVAIKHTNTHYASILPHTANHPLLPQLTDSASLLMLLFLRHQEKQQPGIRHLQATLSHLLSTHSEITTNVH